MWGLNELRGDLLKMATMTIRDVVSRCKQTKSDKMYQRKTELHTYILKQSFVKQGVGGVGWGDYNQHPSERGKSNC